MQADSRGFLYEEMTETVVRFKAHPDGVTCQWELESPQCFEKQIDANNRLICTESAS